MVCPKIQENEATLYFPNPTAGILQIAFDELKATALVELYSAEDKLLQTRKIQQTTLQINMESYPAQNNGMVIVNIAAGDVIQLNNTGSAGSLNLVATLPAVNASILITKL